MDAKQAQQAKVEAQLEKIDAKMGELKSKAAQANAAHQGSVDLNDLKLSEYKKQDRKSMMESQEMLHQYKESTAPKSAQAATPTKDKLATSSEEESPATLGSPTSVIL